MLRVCLFQPEIPPNTGNIIRLCANTGAQLNLIGPLGFSMDTKQLRRAGLDYHDLTQVIEYESWEKFLLTKGSSRIFILSTKGKENYTQLDYRDDDILLFGSETKGLPEHIMQDDNIEQLLTIPMVKGSRSLNLSNSVAIVVYEAWRQMKFKV